jgi:hypothetical protein
LLSTSSFLALLFMMMILWRKLMGGVGDWRAQKRKKKIIDEINYVM